MTLSKLQVVLDATTSAFNRKMDKARTRLTAFNAKVVAGAKKLASFTKSLAAITAVAGGVLAALGVIGKKIFDVTAGLIEIQSKFDTVFGPEGGKKVEKFFRDFTLDQDKFTTVGTQLLQMISNILCKGEPRLKEIIFIDSWGQCINLNSLMKRSRL